MRLTKDFFQRDVLQVAPDLIGKILVRKYEGGEEKRFLITEVEAYRGEEDLACHASKGRTKRTEVMYGEGGKIYVYLIYGMYWMLNTVTNCENQPQAVLVRGVDDEDEEIVGPGKVAMVLRIDKSFYGEDLQESGRLWIEKGESPKKIEILKRVGVDYAGEWANKPWRFRLKK